MFVEALVATIVQLPVAAALRVHAGSVSVGSISSQRSCPSVTLKLTAPLPDPPAVNTRLVELKATWLVLAIVSGTWAAGTTRTASVVSASR